ncbi:MAG: response regulator [Dehalococcoidales bacterium]
MAATAAHILIVDDEPHLRNVLQRILEHEGYCVDTAADGRTALDLVEKEAPDLLLLDIMMPGISGREVCHEVRRIAPATRVIYFTAKAEPMDPSALHELGQEAEAVLAKPSTTRRIVSKIREVLAKPPR